MINDFEKKILDKSARVAVIGLGYVGLPLAVEFAKAGFEVIGIDLIQEKVDNVNKGLNYIGDVDDEELKEVIGNGKLKAYTSFERVREADCVSICVPTPLNRTNDPDMSYIENSTAAVIEYAHENMLVVLESTTYPGTTREVILPEFEKLGYVPGENFFLCFSPERVDPGNPKFNTQNTPKVMGGMTKTCSQMGKMLYEQVIPNIVSVSSCETAELAKLLENTFRSINIGLANEMAIMCEKLGVDVWEVIDAAATKPFGFMKFYPGPGLGGHCIPIDPNYLSWKMKNFNYHARFIEVAEDINKHMPHLVVDKLMKIMNQNKKCINGSKIVMLGMAYKEDIDDLRESPALDIYDLLRKNGADVVYNDDYAVKFEYKDGEIVETVVYNEELLQSADCVIVTASHKYYDPKFIVENSSLVLDTRNITKGIESPRVFKLGSGRVFE